VPSSEICNDGATDNEYFIFLSIYNPETELDIFTARLAATKDGAETCQTHGARLFGEVKGIWAPLALLKTLPTASSQRLYFACGFACSS